MDAFMSDVIAIEREMIRQLIAAGCRYIQIDAPGYTAYGDEISLERMRSRGEDPHENLDRAIRADNAIITGFDDVCFGIHLCCGNVRTTDPNTGHILPQWHRGSERASSARATGAQSAMRLRRHRNSSRVSGSRAVAKIRAHSGSRRAYLAVISDA
jgi:methionine synthase II (cobalamin-independent)